MSLLQPTIKLHPTDVILCGNGKIFKEYTPIRKIAKKGFPNRDPTLFYVKKNNVVVKHITSKSLKVYGFQIVSCRSFDRRGIFDFYGGMTQDNIADILVKFCRGILPVNILTNSAEMVALLNNVIRFKLNVNDFDVVPEEAKMNKRNQPKIKVWYVKKEKMSPQRLSVSDMIDFYTNYNEPPEYRLPLSFTVNRTHCYLMMSAEKKRRILGDNSIRYRVDNVNDNDNDNDVYVYDNGGITIFEVCDEISRPTIAVDLHYFDTEVDYHTNGEGEGDGEGTAAGEGDGGEREKEGEGVRGGGGGERKWGRPGRGGRRGRRGGRGGGGGIRGERKRGRPGSGGRGGRGGRRREENNRLGKSGRGKNWGRVLTRVYSLFFNKF